MSKMIKHLYLFKRPEENVDWDEFEGLVICAKSRVHAKTFIPEAFDSKTLERVYYEEIYNDVVITYLGKATDTVKYGIILENYKWG